MPPEIRNIIYKLSSQNIYSLKKSHKAVYTYDVLNWPDNGVRRRQQMAFNNTGMIKQPALFRSCSLARSEGLPLYYRECKHIFERQSTGESDTIILDWLKALTGQGFYVQRLHFFIAYPDDHYHGLQPLSEFIGSSLRNLTKEIYSILPRDITLYYSDYYRSSFLNGFLVGFASYIHSLRDWLFGNGADAPVFRFWRSFWEGQEFKSLSQAQHLLEEDNENFRDTPATLIASSRSAYYLAKHIDNHPDSDTDDEATA